MPTLKRLIQGQDLAFDTHQAGDGQPIHLNELHLEKRLRRGGKIRYPFFGNRTPTKSKGVTDRDFDRVTREVKKQLEKNPELANDLAKTVVEQLRRFNDGTVTLHQAQEAARKLADCFGLGKDFVATAVVHANARIAQFSSLHLGNLRASVVEIVQSAERVEIQRPTGSWQKWKQHAR